MWIPPSPDFLSLGRGKIKMCQWQHQTPDVQRLFEAYWLEEKNIGNPASFHFCSMNEKMKEILLQIIQKFSGEISNRYTNEKYTKKSAREYILEYRE